MILVTAILAMVMGGFATMSLGVIRLTRNSISEAELSIRMRELREKLLFHITPTMSSGMTSPGLLSGEDYEGVTDWLRPGGHEFISSDAVDRSKLTNMRMYTIGLRGELNGLVRRERVVVPVFGRDQIRDGGVFHD